MIVIYPRGGLCNRLRTLDSAMAMAGKLGQKLNVLWLRTDDFNCNFSDLFVVPGQFNKLVELKYRPLINLLRRVCRAYFLPCFNNRYLGQKVIAGLRYQNEKIEHLCDCKNVFIETFESFYKPAEPFSCFEPKVFLQKVIGRYKQDKMVGVHIRRTDNLVAVKHSPVEKFVEYMDKEIELDSEVRFFVATDDGEVEELLRQRFGGRIVTHEKSSLDRNDPAAFRDAVVDLYCLANCDKLIGSHWSSFTDAAWQINGIEVVIVRE